MTRRSIVCGVVGVLIVGLSALAQSATFVNGVVTRIIDGDTLVVSGVGIVRLIGIDTPEMNDSRPAVRELATQASQTLSTLTMGKLVRLEFDQTRKDRYDRTLAYLYLGDDTLVNAGMVRRGFAHAYLKYPFQKSKQSAEVTWASSLSERSRIVPEWLEPLASRGPSRTAIGRTARLH
jgi:micrococcal nuclease